MTIQRVINRNRLAKGDYGDADEHRVNVNLDHPGLGTQEQFDAHMVNIYRDRLRQYESTLKAILGDIRRLEDDAVDEKAICGLIVHRTGIEPDIVAAVLKEFMAV